MIPVPQHILDYAITEPDYMCVCVKILFKLLDQNSKNIINTKMSMGALTNTLKWCIEHATISGLVNF